MLMHAGLAAESKHFTMERKYWRNYFIILFD